MIFLYTATNNDYIDMFLNYNRAIVATMAIKSTPTVKFDYSTLILHDYILAI